MSTIADDIDHKPHCLLFNEDENGIVAMQMRVKIAASVPIPYSTCFIIF